MLCQNKLDCFIKMKKMYDVKNGLAFRDCVQNMFQIKILKNVSYFYSRILWLDWNVRLLFSVSKFVKILGFHLSY